jgi:uncharacterized protein GlcG (DUF336 family)
VAALAAVALAPGCGSDRVASTHPAAQVEALTAADVGTLLLQAVEQADRLDESVVVAVTDREGVILGIYRMTGTLVVETGPYLPPVSPGPQGTLADAAVRKARTAAYLSSDQHGFTTLTACYITRDHFPPGLENLPGGPLYGVPFSSLAGGDIQPRGNGLDGAPGGVPVFKNGVLAGGIGVAGGSDSGSFDLPLCGGALADEGIALGAVHGYSVFEDERGDVIFLDGIRLLFANQPAPEADFRFNPADLGLYGIVDPAFPVMGSPPPRFPVDGEINLGPGFDFRIRGGSMLTESEVRGIIDNAAARAAVTRAAIRRPLGSPARVFITVCDVDGSILGIRRTSDATLFSFDVSAQKARTAVAFSRPGEPPGSLAAELRGLLGLAATAPLAASTRAIGFLCQDYYPPGIDRETLGRPVEPGPFFGLQESLGLQPHGNGITMFPGGFPLYKNDVLAGAIGVSGDGVDQDDYIAAGGAAGFEPPVGIRSDRFFHDEVRLPYVKFPRRPELQ